MIQCKWCLNYFDKLAKAHLIPEAFIKNYAGTEGRQYIVDGFSKSTKTGWYDTTINCQKCEKEYQSIDAVAIKVLLRDFDKIQIPTPPHIETKVCQISKSYTQDLKRFLLYTFWKCSVSSLPEFKEIKLGKYENEIKQAIIENRTFDDDEFSFLGQFHEKPLGLSLPFKRDKKGFEGRNYYHLDLNKFGFDVKFDSQKTPEVFNLFPKFEQLIFLKFNEPPPKKIEGIKRIIRMNEHYEKSFKEQYKK
jgi:hypothetical protein